MYYVCRSNKKHLQLLTKEMLLVNNRQEMDKDLQNVRVKQGVKIKKKI